MLFLLNTYLGGIGWLEKHLLTCPSKKYLHMECPGCGMQRSGIALLKGDFLHSVILYPALIPLIFLLIYGALHLRYKFSNGSRNIFILQVGVVSIIVLHYVYKIFNHQIFA
ncbi:MAG: DUF2752 domain-containing protein [Bacteroidetes bacterium]|nr:MAG: DUF2752 domain-containing protein [Bacteroidota bacterium]